jgi:hypothetical protein
MMMITYPYMQQDIIKINTTVLRDSVASGSDSDSTTKTLKQNNSIVNLLKPDHKAGTFLYADTACVCLRNSVADITFYDSNNIITRNRLSSVDRFPFVFIGKNIKMQTEARASLIQHLKPGKEIPLNPIHDDLIILIIVIASFLYTLIITTSKNVLPGITRFFLFRGINDLSSRDIGGLFHWQSTISNLISFLIIALFAYCAASYYNFIPSGTSRIFYWLIALGIVTTAVTLRHIVCQVTGSVSRENEVFREYIIGVYHSYRFSSLFLFILIIIMSYTVLIPVKACIFSGIIVLGVMYLFRKHAS